MPDGQAERTITVVAEPRRRWAVNLADAEYGIIRNGLNINVGGDIRADGPFAAFIALWNRPNYGQSGAMDDSDPLPMICASE